MGIRTRAQAWASAINYWHPSQPSWSKSCERKLSESIADSRSQKALCAWGSAALAIKSAEALLSWALVLSFAVFFVFEFASAQLRALSGHRLVDPSASQSRRTFWHCAYHGALLIEAVAQTTCGAASCLCELTMHWLAPFWAGDAMLRGIGHAYARRPELAARPFGIVARAIGMNPFALAHAAGPSWSNLSHFRMLHEREGFLDERLALWASSNSGLLGGWAMNCHVFKPPMAKIKGKHWEGLDPAERQWAEWASSLAERQELDGAIAARMARDADKGRRL